MRLFIGATALLIAGPIWAETSERLPGFNVPAAGPGVIEIQTPILDEVKPGQEVIYCTYLDTTLTEDIFIAGYKAFQSSEGAHHAVLYTTKKPRTPGTYICGSAEESMADQTTFLAGTGGDTPTGPGTSYTLPPQVLFRATKGQQLMIQTHWMNYVGHPFRGQAVFQLETRVPQPSDQIADMAFITTAYFKLDPNDTNRKVQARCTMRDDATFFLTLGHMHEYGKHIEVMLKKTSGETLRLLDHAWNPHFVAVPPTLTDEIKIQKGDEFIVNCTYKDKLDKPLSYPTEMCGVLGFFYPAQKSMACYDNQMR
jgi:hypothetical protein